MESLLNLGVLIVTRNDGEAFLFGDDDGNTCNYYWGFDGFEFFIGVIEKLFGRVEPEMNLLESFLGRKATKSPSAFSVAILAGIAESTVGPNAPSSLTDGVSPVKTGTNIGIYILYNSSSEMQRMDSTSG